MAVTNPIRLPYGMPKPRLRKINSGVWPKSWTCTLVDAKGRYWIGVGLTAEDAYIDLVQKVNYLDRLGLRWEVFP